MLRTAIKDVKDLSVDELLSALNTSRSGLSQSEAKARFDEYGPNAVRTHAVSAAELLFRQLRSPLLLLLALTALLSLFFGGSSDALIIGLILIGSVLLGFTNEYRAAKTAAALHSQLRQRCTVRREGAPAEIDVTELVPGDLIELKLGEIIPADIRLITANRLECDESMISGESSPVPKNVDDAAAVFMGTVIKSGNGSGVVVATADDTEFGRMAVELGVQEPETQFQKGLRDFSMLLMQVAAVLTTGILIVNIVLHRPLLEAIMFSLAIAVGISPQLLPAVVSMSLSAGSRSMAQRKVLVKRLISIEDLGDVELIFTDKTGTLTEGRISFMRSIGSDGEQNPAPILPGLICGEASFNQGSIVGGTELDRALWDSPASADFHQDAMASRVIESIPFDHDSRVSWALIESQGARTAIVKGAPENVLTLASSSEALREVLQQEFADGNRVVAVATKQVSEHDSLNTLDRNALEVVGLLVFLDPPRVSAAAAIARLRELEVDVKVITGDNAVVAETVCRDLGLGEGKTLTGPEIDALSDAQLVAQIAETRIFARTSPEQKARIVRLQRQAGSGVAFLGDGVNDAIALHAADVGISVDSGTDVAKQAADVILLEKDLNVLADGIVEGRRVFANTIKYVLMGTSSNFGNMFSAAGASAFLNFLPMLPSQILLNNLMYDTSQLAIPTDSVDDEQLRKPSHWDVKMIRRFMIFFGPLSSIFDFLTFGLLLWGLHASVDEFRAGWFVESLATQTLIIFVIRTRKTPFTLSRPSLLLALSAISIVAIAALLPLTPLAAPLGFAPLPLPFYAAIAVMTTIYLLGVDQAKRWFFKREDPQRRGGIRRERSHIGRRASRFSTAADLPDS